MHEYTVVNLPRHKILFYIALISMGISMGLNFLIHWMSNLDNLSFLTSYTISVFVIFTSIYWVFNNYLWKCKFFSKILQVPDLSGKWFCKGLSNNIALNKKFDWESEITITQRWDKILIVNKTASSTSNSKSIVGGVHYVEGKGYEVSYHYYNTPNIQQEDLKKHEGFCVLCFDEKLETAEGYYFNNIKERASYGEMKLTRMDDN